MKVQGFGCITQNLCFTTGCPFGAGGPMQRVHRRGSEVMSQCCKVVCSATLARAHVHNLICSRIRGLPSQGVLCREFVKWGTPPPVPKNRLAQEPPPGSAVDFSHRFFLPQYWVFHDSGGCRTAIQVCTTTFHVCCYRSPHHPSPPPPPCSTPSPKQPAPDKETNKSHCVGSWCPV